MGTAEESSARLTPTNAKEDEDAEALRHSFLDQCDDLPSDTYCTRDLAELRMPDKGLNWARLFLRHVKGDAERASKLMNTSFKWRKLMNVSGLRDDDFSADYLDQGGVFYRNKSLSGRDILYFCLKMNKKDPAMAVLSQKMIAMLLERHRVETQGEKIVILFDLTDVGLSNVDIELLKYIITSFTTYFPDSLECLLCYEMPWIISGVWKIVRLLLSEEERKAVIFCKKANITDHVAKENLFTHMGGTDTYKYRYVPYDDPRDSAADAISVTSASPSESEPIPGPSGASTSAGPSAISSLDAGDSLSAQGRKADTTAGLSNGTAGGSTPNGVAGPSGLKRSASLSAKSAQNGTGDRIKGVAFSEEPSVQLFESVSEPSEPAGSKGKISKKEKASGGESAISVQPSSELVFVRPDINSDAPASIALTNTHDTSALAFKIKTTDPEHYRVRTSFGRLKPGKSCKVSITLLNGKEIHRDKFLVLHTLVKEDEAVSTSQLSAFWRSIPPGSVHEHRLRCVERQEALDQSTRNQNSVSSGVTELRELDKKVDALMRDVQHIGRVQVFILLLLALTILLLFFSLVTPTPSSCSAGF